MQTNAAAPGGVCATCSAHTGTAAGCAQACPACAALVQAVASTCQGASALSLQQQAALSDALYGSDCFTLLDVLLAGNITCSDAFQALLSVANTTAGAPLAAVYPCLAAGPYSCPTACQRELDVLGAACHMEGECSVAPCAHACRPRLAWR